MRVLVERPGDPSVLDRAWEDPESFCLVAPKAGVGAVWLEEQWARLPKRFDEGHFGLLTSGSTGAPKLVVGERARAEALARLLHEVQDSAGLRAAVLTLPLSYCYSFVNQWLWARLFGRELVVTRGFSEPERLGAALREARDAMLCLVGSQLPLFEAHLPDLVAPGVTRLHFAGGPFPQERLPALRERFPNARVFNNYGCAEAMPRLTVRAAEAGESAADIGRPLPGVELRTQDGELYFRSPFGAVALVEAERVCLPAPDEWLATGDLAEPREDGSWRLAGRTGEVFKRFGEKVSLARVRELARAAVSVEVATYRDTDRLGEPGYCLLLSPPPSDEDVRAVLSSLRRALKRSAWPLRIESVEALPHLPNGKVAVAALADLDDKHLHWKNRI